MNSYNTEFKYSLDHIEQVYSKFIHDKLPNYVNYWEEFVGLSGIERGRLIGYKLTFREGKLKPLQKALKSKFDEIRKTVYSVLIQSVLIETFDESQFFMEDYLVSVKCVQNLTNSIGTLYYYLSKVWNSLSNLEIKLNGVKLERVDGLIIGFNEAFSNQFHQFILWRDVHVHNYVIPRHLDVESGIRIPLGEDKQLYKTNDFVFLHTYFENFKDKLMDFLNLFFEKLKLHLSKYIMASDADLDKPLVIQFHQDGKIVDIILIDPETKEQMTSTPLKLSDLFKDGYNRVKDKLGVYAYIPSSGTIDPTSEKENDVGFF
jgi:hypothetical protein